MPQLRHREPSIIGLLGASPHISPPILSVSSLAHTAVGHARAFLSHAAVVSRAERLPARVCFQKHLAFASIRAPRPLNSTVIHGNTFVFLIGHIFIQTCRRHCLIDATHMHVIPPNTTRVNALRTHQSPSGHTLFCKQFPLAPAYATTFNSCQGLTLDRVALDLTRPVFSHGQLYTALTRVRTRFHAIVRLTPGESTARNVTYNELFCKFAHNNI